MPEGRAMMTTASENVTGNLAARSQRVHEAMSAHVARGSMPGATYAVSERRDVHVDAIGDRRVGGGAPMTRDTLFRIASMTKPMAAAVAMMLVEEGVLALDAPVDRWLPELANRRVLKRIDGPLEDTVPAKRAITVRDLLTFRMGFGIVWGPPNALPIQRAAKELHLGAFGPPRVQDPPAPEEWMRRFSTLPLMHQPGEGWRYNTSAEVLGVLLARASGRPFDVLLRERLFDPLGMKDTGFWVRADQVHRLATSYFANPETGGLDLYDPAEGGDFTRPPAFCSGGAGLVSTVDDCLAFAQMMCDPGARGDVRVLSPASVSAMTTDQITAEQKAASGAALDPAFWEHFGWGYGCAVATLPLEGGPLGAGWDGGLGTSMWWDARAQRIGVLLTQRSAYPTMSPVYLDFWRAVRG
jgi:CubicO group peptidase (beta-lactamase class C family)